MKLWRSSFTSAVRTNFSTTNSKRWANSSLINYSRFCSTEAGRYSHLSNTQQRKREYRRLKQIENQKPPKTMNGNVTPTDHPELTVEHPYPLEKPSGENIFAVFALGGTQFKATIDDLLVVNKLPLREAPVGEIIDITDVLLVGSLDETVIGRPLVKGAKVRALVQEQSKDGKVIVFKRRRRKSSQTWNGFRRNITLLRVKEIICPQLTFEQPANNFEETSTYPTTPLENQG